MHVVTLARNGWIARDIAEALGKSTRAIQQWVGDCNTQELEGLPGRRRRGNGMLNAVLANCSVSI